ADHISAQGDVSNKTGSFCAAVMTKRANLDAKVLVLSETDKITGIDEQLEDHGAEDNNALELVQAWPLDAASKEKLVKSPLVKIRNIYFEWVPGALIDVYLTEEGPLLK